MFHWRIQSLYPLFHLAAMLGSRRGELARLQWGDIDVAAQVLVVSRQVRREPGGCLAIVRAEERGQQSGRRARSGEAGRSAPAFRTKLILSPARLVIPFNLPLPGSRL